MNVNTLGGEGYIGQGFKSYEINQLSNDHLKLLYLISNLRRESKESFKKCSITELQLNLADERMFQLDWLIFKKEGFNLFEGSLANIERLGLGFCSIGEKLNSDTFQNLKSLSYLSLGSNEITYLPDGVFNNLYFLKELNLSVNNITNLQVDCFKDLHNLESLNLLNNELTTLPSGIFRQLVKAESIILSYNHLKEVPNDLFEDLACLNEVWLHCDEAKESDGYTFVRIGSNSIKIPGRIEEKDDEGGFHSLNYHVKISRKLIQKP